VDSLLRTVGRRVGETFRIPPRQQALERAAETAITVVIDDWQIPITGATNSNQPTPFLNAAI